MWGASGQASHAVAARTSTGEASGLTSRVWRRRGAVGRQQARPSEARTRKRRPMGGTAMRAFRKAVCAVVAGAALFAASGDGPALVPALAQTSTPAGEA